MAQVAYIRFDTDFFDKPKIKGLIHRNGQDAALLLIRLLCAMGRATDGTLNRDAWEAIGVENGMTVERAETVVQYCLTQGIVRGDLDGLTNERVSMDQQALEKKRDATRERVAKSRQQKREHPHISIAPPNVSVPQVTAPPMQQLHVVHSTPTVNHVPTPTPQLTPLPDVDTNMEIALDKLENPSGQPWTNDNRYIAAGRRPMRDYPQIWMTPNELADVIKKLEASDIPLSMYKDLFLKAEARLMTYSTQGRSTTGVSVYNWLTGFLFDELLERTIKETRLAKTKEVPQRYEQRR